VRTALGSVNRVCNSLLFAHSSSAPQTDYGQTERRKSDVNSGAFTIHNAHYLTFHNVNSWACCYSSTLHL